MSDNHGTSCNRGDLLDNFAAELASAAYSIVLRHGMTRSWIELELGLWRALAATVKKWAEERPPAESSKEFKVWREGLLVDLTESALYIAANHRINESLLEMERGLHRGFGLVIRRREVLMKYGSLICIGVPRSFSVSASD